MLAADKDQLVAGLKKKALEIRHQELEFYCFASLAMSLSLYVVIVASFSTVYGHRLALQGPKGSVSRAVAVFIGQRNQIFIVFALSLASLVGASICMAIAKFEQATYPVISIFAGLFVALTYQLVYQGRRYHIANADIVTGEVHVDVGDSATGARLDLASMEQHMHTQGAGSSSQSVRRTAQDNTLQEPLLSSARAHR